MSGSSNRKKHFSSNRNVTKLHSGSTSCSPGPVRLHTFKHPTFNSFNRKLSLVQQEDSVRYTTTCMRGQRSCHLLKLKNMLLRRSKKTGGSIRFPLVWIRLSTN